MVDFVVDKSLDLLLKQVDEAAPERSKESDGSVGDPDHQARESAHNPEDTEDSMDGNDPDEQVDARDFTHDPAHGADMYVMTEALRISRDRRLYLVIFNGRQFSSYARDGYAPFTWRPYYGTNKHTKHAHVEVNDYYNDTLTPWKIGIDMGLTREEYDEIVKGVRTNDNALYWWLQALGTGKVPVKGPQGYDWNNLVDAPFPGLQQLGERVDDLEVHAGVIDYALLKQAVREVLREELNNTRLTNGQA